MSIPEFFPVERMKYIESHTVERIKEDTKASFVIKEEKSAAKKTQGSQRKRKLNAVDAVVPFSAVSAGNHPENPHNAGNSNNNNSGDANSFTFTYEPEYDEGFRMKYLIPPSEKFTLDPSVLVSGGGALGSRKRLKMSGMSKTRDGVPEDFHGTDEWKEDVVPEYNEDNFPNDDVDDDVDEPKDQDKTLDKMGNAATTMFANQLPPVLEQVL